MWPFKNKAREAVERRLEKIGKRFVEEREQRLAESNLQLRSRVVGASSVEIWFEPAGACEPDPYAWHSTADMVGR